MAIRNKIAKSFPMWSRGSIIIAQFSKYKITISQNRRSFSMLSILKMLSIFSGSRGPDGPDLPSPFWRKFQLSVPVLYWRSKAGIPILIFIDCGIGMGKNIVQACCFSELVTLLTPVLYSMPRRLSGYHTLLWSAYDLPVIIS